MAEFIIVSGEFALVASGNGTRRWIIHDENTQERANKAIDPYWHNGDHDIKIEQIETGSGIFFSDGLDSYAVEMFVSLQAAKQYAQALNLALVPAVKENHVDH